MHAVGHPESKISFLVNRILFRGIEAWVEILIIGGCCTFKTVPHFIDHLLIDKELNQILIGDQLDPVLLIGDYLKIRIAILAD